MGIFISKEIEPLEFTQGELNAFVAAGESKQKDAMGRMRDCLSRGLAIDIRADDDDGLEFTCLLRACRVDSDGCCDKVEYLLDHGANPKLPSKSGYRPIDIIKNDTTYDLVFHDDILEALKAKGATD